MTLLGIDNMGVNETDEVEVSNRGKEGECASPILEMDQTLAFSHSNQNRGYVETTEVIGKDNMTAGKELVEITKRILKNTLKFGKIAELQVGGDEDEVLRHLAAIRALYGFCI
ncbi:hypothetical protein GOBAR_AA35130 [Gossypium barbadense]|uniref:Uncharacterized protein n=1 Tax=Gossypium barbadense TaxID=3634 RepID=A0A2P5W3C1_GOSBA|nr:hypothetical protein GOBAR_AA35130 [Gossypium barbadense]